MMVFGKGIIARRLAEQDCKHIKDEKKRRKCIERRIAHYLRW